jgi:long-chain acyl-CoA synthetase
MSGAAADPTGGIVSGARRLAHPALEDEILRAAGGFVAAGVGAGDCVALLLRNDFPFLVASLAAQRVGAYAVPVNWHLKSEEIGFILRDCAAKVLVVHADLLPEALPAVPPGMLVSVARTPEEVRAAYRISSGTMPPDVVDWETWLAQQAPYAGPAVPPTLSMIYTSGTTGRPKGVRRLPATPEQQVRLDASRTLVFGLAPGVRALMPGPLYHSAPNAFGLRAARLAERFVLMPRFDARQFLALVEEHRIDTTFMVPTMLVRLLQLPEAERRRYDISSLRFVMHAAAPCPPDVKRRIIEWWGPVLWEFYGATEAGAVSVISAEEWLARPGSVGRPVEGAAVRIYDEEGRVLPAGEIGEVYSRIEYYPEFTYHGAPKKRREVERDGFVTCGDVGYLDEAGYLFLCDRKRDMVISGGVNIYPAEIEAVLVTMPGVADCAVFGIPDPDLGEQVMAVAEPLPGAVLAPDAIRAFLAARIADYKVPRRIEIGRDLPREDSGKIFKRRLRDPFWQAAGRRI